MSRMAGSYGWYMSSFLKKIPNDFSKWLCCLHFHQQILRFPVATHPCKDLICSVFIILDTLKKRGSVSHCDFNTHFPEG